MPQNCYTDVSAAPVDFAPLVQTLTYHRIIGVHLDGCVDVLLCLQEFAHLQEDVSSVGRVGHLKGQIKKRLNLLFLCSWCTYLNLPILGS